jgi:moderate conductance mechanosensitive channel
MQSYEVTVAVPTVLREIARFIQNWAAVVRSAINLVLVGLLALVLLTAWVPTASGSLPLVKIWEQQLQRSDRGVQRLGNIEATPVHFEGAALFTLASPTVWDWAQVDNQLPVEIRAKQVEANLNRVIEGGFIHGREDGILTNFDPKTLQVSIASLNDVPVIIAGDGFHSQPLKLVTVTYIDAEYSGQPIAALAEQWRSILYQRLYAALMERSPAALTLQGKLGESLVTILLAGLASLVLWLLQMPLKRRNQRLRMQQIAIATDLGTDLGTTNLGTDAVSDSLDLPQPTAEQRLMQLRAAFLETFQRRMALQQQRSLIGFFRWLLAWGQVAIWIGGLATALALFPWTRHYAQLLLGVPAFLLLIWFLTSWVNRMASALLQALAEAWVKFGSVAADDPQRDTLRIFTILAAIKPLKTLVIYGIGGVIGLVYVGVPLSLVLSVGTIIGLALLLIGQAVVKDWVMGGLMIWEDQYAIGDVVVTQNQMGLVERMNLRLTQLLNLEGRLISIANGSITQVENLTRNGLRQARKAGIPKGLEPSSGLNGNLNPFNSAELNGIDFSGTDFSGTDFSGTDFSSELNSPDFNGADPGSGRPAARDH